MTGLLIKLGSPVTGTLLASANTAHARPSLPQEDSVSSELSELPIGGNAYEAHQVLFGPSPDQMHGTSAHSLDNVDTVEIDLMSPEEEDFRRTYDDRILKLLYINSEIEAPRFVDFYYCEENRDLHILTALDYLRGTNSTELMVKFGWSPAAAPRVIKDAKKFMANLEQVHKWMQRYELYRSCYWQGRYSVSTLCHRLRDEIVSSFREPDLQRLSGELYDQMVLAAKGAYGKIALPILINAFIKARLKDSGLNQAIVAYVKTLRETGGRMFPLQKVLVNERFDYDLLHVPLREILSAIDPSQPEYSFKWSNKNELVSLDVSVDRRAEIKRLKDVLQKKGWLLGSVPINGGEEIRVRFQSEPMNEHDPGAPMEIIIRVRKRGVEQASKPAASGAA